MRKQSAPQGSRRRPGRTIHRDVSRKTVRAPIRAADRSPGRISDPGIAADHHAWMNHDARAHPACGENRMRMHDTILTKFGPSLNDGVG